MTPSPFRFTTLCYDAAARPHRSVDVFLPEVSTRKLALLFVHGGGWSGGSKTDMHALMHALVERGWPCGSADYRLGQVTARDQLEDVRRGRELFTQFLHEQGHATSLVLQGSSAGAHLALLEAMTNRSTPAAGVIAISAPLTFEPWDEAFPPIQAAMRRIAGQRYEDDPALYRALSPIHQIDEHTPPICLLDGENEHMFPSWIAQAFMQRMQALGRPVQRHVYEHAEHGFLYDTTRPCQQRALKDIIAFLEARETAVQKSTS